MGLVLMILLGVAILGSFFVAYMSARTWPIYQAVLVAFIFLFTVGFFYLSAKTLAIHSAWRTLAKKTQTDLETTEKQVQQLTDGGGPDAEAGKGIRQLRQEWAKMALDRGGALFDVAVDGVKDGTVQLTPKSPNHGLVPNAVIFVFDQLKMDDGGRYQGEFKVAAVAENGSTLELVPNLPLTEAQSKRLTAAQGPWTLYTTMPIDDPALVPGDMPDRKLRDYERAFHEGYVQRSLLSDSIAKLTSNVNRTTAAVDSTEDDVAYREQEIEDLGADLERFQFERDVTAEYRQTLERNLEELRELLKATFARNRQLAALWTASQLEAARQAGGPAAGGPAPGGGAAVGAPPAMEVATP